MDSAQVLHQPTAVALEDLSRQAGRLARNGVLSIPTSARLKAACFYAHAVSAVLAWEPVARHPMRSEAHAAGLVAVAGCDPLSDPGDRTQRAALRAARQLTTAARVLVDPDVDPVRGRVELAAAADALHLAEGLATGRLVSEEVTG